MVFFIAVLLLIVFNGIIFCNAEEFNQHYLDKKNTTAINGIFVILVVFSHYSQYADFGGAYDYPYIVIKEHLNQLVVATFWFYSGYGMMESIRKTKGEYIKKLPKKFWQLLFRFDCAVVLFWILNALYGTYYPAKQIALSFIAWGTIGNSNWYIFAILVEYLLLFASFTAVSVEHDRFRNIAGIILFVCLTIFFVFVLMKAGRPRYTYNTVIILPVGMLYSEFKEKIEKWVQKNDLVYLTVVVMLLGIYVLSFFRRWDYGIEGYTVWALSFIILLVVITMKININNPLLEWFGNHIFSIYILQRIPMSILYQSGCIANHRYICLVVVLAVTMLIALAFENITNIGIKRIDCTFAQIMTREKA